jgi:hypothetical protein
MSHASFDQRLSRIIKEGRRGSLGVTYRVGPDGRLTAAPRRRLGRFPLGAILLVLAAAFVFKAGLFVTLGEGTYESRRDILVQGNVAERAAAWVMQPDPAVRLVATLVEQVAGR